MMDSERFSRSAKYAHEYLSQFGDLPPMTLGFNDETGEEICLVTPWEDEHQQDLCCGVIRLVFALHGVNEYHFMSEAWMVSTSGNDQAGRIKEEVRRGKRISEMPGRVEVVIVLGVSYTEPLGRIVKFPLLRDRKGQFLKLGPAEEFEGGGQGRMLNLLPSIDSVVPEEIKSALREFIETFRWKPDVIEAEGVQ